MIQDTLKKIETRLSTTDTVQEDSRKELLTLLETLKTEIGDLAKTHTEQAESITGFADQSTREAVRQEINSELLDLSVRGLASSVQGFETSHPQLVDIVNRLCTVLYNMGI